ncbi:MAG: histidine kinase dimerization/phospho-acceptor domain-containing protein, partial [bacterium]
MTNRFFVWQKKRILFMLLCSLIMALCCFQTAFAASGQVVRVGYYERPGFQEGVGPNERKSGYAYEYLQKVSDYTGWKYRYIYKDLDTLKQMMDKGEVDLIAGFSRHDDIPKQAEFADEPFGTETCYIYKRADDDSIKPGYIVGLIGKRIGVVYKAPAAAYLKKFMQDKAFSCQVVTYGSAGELVKALKAGKIDAFAAKDLNVGNISEIVPCLSISRDDFYVCVLSGKRTVLRELNEADMRLRNVEPYFLNQLYFKYYQNVSASVMQSNEEASWLLVHNKLRIGYLKNYMPYCGMDEKGNVTGLLKDYIESLRSEPELAGLVIEAVPYDNLSMAYADLNQKKINAIFPYYGDTWYAEMTNVRKSVTVFSQTVDLIFDGTYSDEVMNTVVLSTTNSVLKGYIEKFYPDSKVIEVSSNDECIAAVKSGRATSTIMNRYKTSRYLHKTANQSLHSTGLPNLCNISFVVRSTDVELLSLLNRGILVMGDKKIDSSVNRYIYYDYDYSWSNFVAEHMQESILLVSCFIAFLLAIFIFYINSTRRNQRRMELAQSEIQKARDLLAGALEKAEFANASKSTFLFNMSHDIRTPMNAILGFADLLEKYDDEPKKRREYVANIRTAGGYLLSLINEVLEMARIESGKVSLNEEAGNFLDMIDSLHVVLSEGYEKKNLQITRNINIQHPHVFYDFTKERAIFLN